MSFLLRIFFSGLIAFVQSSDGKELTVLLLDTPEAYRTSDGGLLPHHEPMLLARAADCSGACSRDDDEIAHVLFSEVSHQASLEALAVALDGGAAWRLSGSDVTLAGDGDVHGLRVLHGSTSSRVPRTPAEREAFDWVPSFQKIAPKSGGLDPRMLGPHPPALIAARFHLGSGRVSTYRLVQVDGKVTPIEFKPLKNGSRVALSQAVASWVVAELQITGDALEVVDRNFRGGSDRSMKLTPRDGTVELAFLNLPEVHQPTSVDKLTAGQPGRHFEIYYELTKTPPAKSTRPVPHANRDTPDLEADWSALHANARPSTLLEDIRFGGPRGPYDQTLCPMTNFP